MSKEQAVKMYARRAAAKAEAAVSSIVHTVEEVAEAVIPPSLLPYADHDSDDAPSEAPSTPVEEIDSGIEMEEPSARSSGIQLKGVQTRARTRKV
jgi:hypothetical protein